MAQFLEGDGTMLGIVDDDPNFDDSTLEGDVSVGVGWVLRETMNVSQ